MNTILSHFLHHSKACINSWLQRDRFVGEKQVHAGCQVQINDAYGEEILHCMDTWGGNVCVQLEVTLTN